MNDSLTFYTNPISRGQIARWMLEEVEADYEEVVIEYGEEMKSPEFLAINPMGKVPVIKHGDRVVTECAAICAYLAGVFPEANLAPPPEQRGEYYRWLFFAAGPVEAAVTNKSLGFEVNDEQKRMAGYGDYATVISVLDELLTNRRYLCGDQFTAADVYLGSHIAWGLQFGSIEERDSFKTYSEGLHQRDAFKRAAAKDQARIQAAESDQDS